MHNVARVGVSCVKGTSGADENQGCDWQGNRHQDGDEHRVRGLNHEQALAENNLQDYSRDNPAENQERLVIGQMPEAHVDCCGIIEHTLEDVVD